jgi:spore maturation protein CgeB
LTTYLLEPVKRLGLRAIVYGVRYPDHALKALDEAGIAFGGWIANHEVPLAFSNAHLTVHIPRRPYARSLPGIPTIRPFEAMACGIPLICAPWEDSEHLFEPGTDYLVAHSGESMESAMHMILDSPLLAGRMSHRGRRTILARHTCAHRVRELMTIASQLGSRARLRWRPKAVPVPRQHERSNCNNCNNEGDLTMSWFDIAFFGSSILSAYWNGAATYYRGVIRSLNARGHRVTFFEPDAFDRQRHRDIDDPGYARCVVYPASEQGARDALEQARGADIVVKASGVGVFDNLLEREVLKFQREGAAVLYWDVDAPATLDRMAADPDDALRPLVPRFDAVLTYGGGPPWWTPTAAWARGAVSPSTTPSIQTRTTRCHPTRVLRPAWPSWAIACPTARRASASSSSALPGSCPGTPSCWRQRMGEQRSPPGQRADRGPRLHPRPQRLQLLAVGCAECVA